MLDVRLTEDQEAVRAVARRIGAEILDPAARDAEDAGAIPSEVWRRLAETGLCEIPDTLTTVVVAEELGHGDAAIAFGALTSGAVPVLAGLLDSANTVAPVAGRPDTIALSEGFGRGPSEWGTTLIPGGAGRWHLQGTKAAVPWGPGAGRILVFAHDPGAGRIRAAIVAPGDRGLEILPAPGVGHLALAAVPLHQVRFDTEIEPSALLGGPDADPAVLERFVARLRLQPAAVALGCAARATEYAASYASERIAFGQPLAAFQGVSFLLADAMVQLGAARLDLWALAAELDNDGRGVGAPGPSEGRVARAVNYACGAAAGITRDALQVLGGHGFIRDHPVERWYRNTAMISALDFDPTCSAFAPAL